MDAESWVAVRMRKTGLWLIDHRALKKFGEKPRFLPSEGVAQMIVRVDLGLDLDEVEIIPRDKVKGFS